MSSSDVAVSVEGLGKRYYTPMRNPAMRSSITAHLRNMGLLGASEEDYFWALKDVTFEVPRGKILGIMGKNGSGKSTLLKILTGVTPPTRGKAVLRGKVGSLLEVGTGFHPDLSGRDNVFMSGSLLGIPQNEIQARFDEIVDFAGIEDFIEVPVKRYSSGMYVRLAYAVASMLQSEILILDEVLAVGDLAFLEKARKNIQEIAQTGRTILFVSHNVRILSDLCDDGIILNKGRIVFRGSILPTVHEYLQQIQNLHEIDNSPQCYADLREASRWDHCSKNETKVISYVKLFDEDGLPASSFHTGGKLRIVIGFQNVQHAYPCFEIIFVNEFGERAATISSTHAGQDLNMPRDGEIMCEIDDLRLGEGVYSLILDYGTSTGNIATYVSRDSVTALRLKIQMNNFVKGHGINSTQGAVHVSHWNLIK